MTTATATTNVAGQAADDTNGATPAMTEELGTSVAGRAPPGVSGEMPEHRIAVLWRDEA